MKNITLLFASIVSLVLASCNNQEQNNTTNIPQDTMIVEELLTEAELWVADAIEAHGGEKYKTAHYTFNFRDKTYRFKNEGQEYTYELKEKKEDGTFWKHTLRNGEFFLSVEGKEKALDKEQVDKYQEALNSVIYFATLPSKLNDEAVIVDQKGETFINDTAYQLIVIQFNKDNGGKDFKDQYLYWINHQTKQVDYLAYSYEDENGGGTRFRKAYNKVRVDGILFQDYINYKGAANEELYLLAEQFERGELEELSRIELTDIKAVD